LPYQKAGLPLRAKPKLKSHSIEKQNQYQKVNTGECALKVKLNWRVGKCHLRDDFWAKCAAPRLPRPAHLHFRSIKSAEPEEQLVAHLGRQKKRKKPKPKTRAGNSFLNALKARDGAANGLVPRRKQN